jgi:CRP-like cAMP-binding protein
VRFRDESTLAMTTDEKVALLRNLPGLKDVDEAILVSLAETAQEFQFAPGQLIAREGQMGTGMYLILEGRINVVQHGVRIDTSGPGEFIGELSPLSQSPRIATLMAVEPVLCLGIASWHLDELMQQPAIAERIREVEQAHRRAEEERRAPRTSGGGPAV